MMKEFRDSGYFVFENGEILGKTKKLKKTDLPDGYQSVCLYINGSQKNFLVHRIVAETYLPNVESKPQVNHIDSDKKNNSVSNLEWVTSKENINHYRKKLGLGEFPNSKLSFDEMVEIYRYYKEEGIYQKDLAQKYKVDRSTIVRAIKKIQKYV